MAKGNTAVPVPALSEVVLKTSRFDLLKDWYSKALVSEPFFVRPRPEKASWTGAMQIAFFKLAGEYPYSQILGIFEVDETATNAGNDPGLHHFQLAHGRFEELFDRYDHLKSFGILPHQSWNHGVCTSFYYHDPDENIAELICTNFATEAEFVAYFNSDAYKKNVSGIAIGC